MSLGTLKQEFVIGGYRPEGSNSFDALLVCYYDGPDLRFAGKVRSACTARTARQAQTPQGCSLSVRKPTRRYDRSLGRWSYRRPNVGHAVDAAKPGGAGPFCRVDGPRPA